MSLIKVLTLGLAVVLIASGINESSHWYVIGGGILLGVFQALTDYRAANG